MTWIRSTFLSVLAAVAWLLCASPAAGAQEPSQEDLRAAKRLMEEGQALYLRRDFSEAAARFLEAHAKVAHPAFLYNAAVAFARGGDGLNALRYFEQYLREAPDAPDAAKVRERIQVIRDYLRRTGQLPAEREAPSSAESGPSDRAGAETEGDGTEGESVSDSEAGAEPSGAREEGGDEAGSEAPAAPARAAQPLPSGVVEEDEAIKSVVSVKSNPPDARVTLLAGGRVVAASGAPFLQSVPAGEYEIQVEHPDFRTIRTKVDVSSGRVYVLIVEMSQGQFLGFLRVVSQPPGARVYLDDRSEGHVGRTPWMGPVPVGEHRVWVEKPGYQLVERQVEVGIGDEQELEVPLERVRYGKLRVVANVPGAEVYVDGRKVGVVPYEGEHPAGARSVRVEADGMKAWEEEVDLPRGQLVPIRVRLRPSVPRGGAWGALAVAVAAAGGGVYLMLEGERIEEELAADRAAGRLVQDDPRISRGKWFTYGADAAYGLSAIMTLLSFYYFVRDPLPDSEGRVLQPRDWALRPWTGPGLAGGSLQWRF